MGLSFACKFLFVIRLELPQWWQKFLCLPHCAEHTIFDNPQHYRPSLSDKIADSCLLNKVPLSIQAGPFADEGKGKKQQNNHVKCAQFNRADSENSRSKTLNAQTMQVLAKVMCAVIIHSSPRDGRGGGEVHFVCIRTIIIHNWYFSILPKWLIGQLEMWHLWFNGRISEAEKNNAESLSSSKKTSLAVMAMAKE